MAGHFEFIFELLLVHNFWKRTAGSEIHPVCLIWTCFGTFCDFPVSICLTWIYFVDDNLQQWVETLSIIHMYLYLFEIGTILENSMTIAFYFYHRIFLYSKLFSRIIFEANLKSILRKACLSLQLCYQFHKIIFCKMKMNLLPSLNTFIFIQNSAC